ncbi:hypothetical protein E3N88_08955 [Mikania micrantha]|uniref:RRM domain-containing protein n=1 Tax=Mikania micrantha TaxID=192012 RepID=A0A5N6PHQ1_9ASTR|nr:hypothetical protein E3N88_08955 [Mikania micrantha]
MKKIRSCITDNQLLAQALCSSSKLSRTVVAKNLPEDHSHQNLEKIFGIVRSVKSIRICNPQEPNSSRSRGDYVLSSKLHALVEYETVEMAENAVEKLNDERNWQKGLRVRLLLRRSSVLKSRKSEFDGIFDDDNDESYDLPEESSQTNVTEPYVDNNAEEGSKKGWARGCGKSKIRISGQTGRGVHSQSPQSSGSTHSETPSPKQSPKGPRMPDGTRGFTMGRGKPMSPFALTTTP